MKTWMEYLHIQQPIDGIWHNETINGVPVVLTAIGSDGSSIDIGTVTTDGYYGTFSKSWTPPEEGDYKIIASFAGDDSYGSSSAATAVSVGPATATPETPEIPTPVDNTMLLYGILIAVIIAIVLAIIAILIVLRKR
jgi:subtilase family serine protease